MSCSLVVTGWERADLLDLLYVAFSFVCHMGQVGNMIVSIPDLCHLPYFYHVLFSKNDEKRKKKLFINVACCIRVISLYDWQ